MADYISDDDILSAIKGTKSSSGGNNIYSGKSVQIGGYTEPETKPKFDVTQTYGTPAKLLDNTIQVESSGNPHAINRESGAMGIGQFMPDTVAMLHKQGVEFNPFNPVEARAAMDYYISTLAKKHGGDYTKAMIDYGGFKTKDPSQYLSKVLHEVDNTPHDASLIADEQLLNEARALNISPNDLIEQQKLTPSRAAGLFARGMAPAVTGASAGQLVAGPAGALVGSMALPAGDILNTGVNAVTGGINKYAGTNIPPLQMPSNMVSQWMTKAGLPVAQSTGERMIESAGSALGGTGGQVPALANLATTAASPTARSIAGQLAQAPVAQAISAPLSAAVGQGVTERYDNPLLGMAAGMATAAPFGFKFYRGAINAPSQDALIAESNLLYDKAKNSGVSFDKKEFAGAMQNIAKDLMQKGYSENVHTGIAGVLKELQDTSRPIDMLRLQGLRELIAGEQSDMKPKVKMLATELKHRFDDYVLNAPDTAIRGNKQGLQSWKEARTVYSKLSKAEIFDEMLEKSTRAASSPENSLTSQLRALSNNPKRMRLFTQEEQNAIKQAATPGVLEKGLKGFGKFSPTNPLAALFNLELMHQLPYGIGSTIALGSAASKKLAGAQKVQNVTNLADMMRLGKVPELESRYQNIPATALRGLLSGQPTPEGQ